MSDVVYLGLGVGTLGLIALYALSLVRL